MTDSSSARDLEPAADRPAGFDAVLYPNRSLPPLGFAVLMGGVAAISAGIGAGFVLMGAWPVTGFLGLDVLLLYLAFRWNYRQGRCTEFIRLDQASLSVRRLEPSGRLREWCFEPYWVRVQMDDPPRHDSALTLSSHGRRLAVGAFLTARERLEVATALRAALDEHLSWPDGLEPAAPSYVNPSLSESNPAS